MDKEKYSVLSINRKEEFTVETPKVDPLYEKAFLKSDKKETTPESENTTAWD